MKVEKIIFILATLGLVSMLIQAISRKMLVFNLWGYVITTLQISVLFLFTAPLAIYGLIKLIDNLEEKRTNKYQTELQ